MSEHDSLIEQTKTPRTDALFKDWYGSLPRNAISAFVKHGKLKSVWRHADELERELSSLAAEVASLRAERDALLNADTVPASRYWACNTDWLRERDRADMLLSNGKEAIETLLQDVAKERQRAESAEARVLEVERDAKRYQFWLKHVQATSDHIDDTHWHFTVVLPAAPTVNESIDKSRALLKARGDTDLSVSDYSKGER